MDIVLQSLPLCTDVCYRNNKEIFSRETFVNLNRLQRLRKFKRFAIHFFTDPPNFDCTLLSNFVYQNITPTSICLFLIYQTKMDETNFLKTFANAFEKWDGNLPQINIMALNKAYSIFRKVNSCEEPIQWELQTF